MKPGLYHHHENNVLYTLFVKVGFVYDVCTLGLGT